jgi:arylsulfatase A-like enzyme
MKAFGMPNRAEMQKAGLSPDEYVGFDKDWYDGSIRGMDAELGRLLEYLRESGLEGKVQFAFIADHGEEFIDHGRTFHGQTAYGELSGVPLILYRPGVVPAGKRVSETTRSIDLMPTLLTLSGLPVPSRAQGQSLVPLLTGSKAGWKNEPAVTEKALTKGGAAPPPGDTESYALVHDGWKLVHNVHRAAGTNEFELYHHAEDPLDLRDLAAQHPELIEKLKPQLAAWHKKVDAEKLPEGGQSEKLSPKEMERLKSLGYVQ